ncbi:hypothetical protein, partial [Marininema halotolerans]|uniref:hypothetical protein n=1 Tax=Marininema halotolerans TaxID=1155944 RepID=UPI001C3C2AD6
CWIQTKLKRFVHGFTSLVLNYIRGWLDLREGKNIPPSSNAPIHPPLVEVGSILGAIKIKKRP